MIETSGEKENSGEFNPVEKFLITCLRGCDEKLINSPEFLKEVKNEVIRLSRATEIEGVTVKFEPQGVSQAYVLGESHFNSHSSPQYKYISYTVSTCGSETHPFLAAHYILEKFNPSSGEILYFKHGMDRVNKSVIFPKSIESFVKKPDYIPQFNLANYQFIGRELKACFYDFLFWDSSRTNKEDVARCLCPLMKELELYVPISSLLEKKNGS